MFACFCVPVCFICCCLLLSIVLIVVVGGLLSLILFVGCVRLVMVGFDCDRLVLLLLLLFFLCGVLVLSVFV